MPHLSDQVTNEQQILELNAQLEEARDEAELNLLMLQQVQEELEFYFLSQQKQGQVIDEQRQQLSRAEALIEALLERLEHQS